jgi:hypothetical protein
VSCNFLCGFLLGDPQLNNTFNPFLTLRKFKTRFFKKKEKQIYSILDKCQYAMGSLGYLEKRRIDP